MLKVKDQGTFRRYTLAILLSQFFLLTKLFDLILTSAFCCYIILWPEDGVITETVSQGKIQNSGVLTKNCCNKMCEQLRYKSEECPDDYCTPLLLQAFYNGHE